MSRDTSPAYTVQWSAEKAKELLLQRRKRPFSRKQRVHTDLALTFSAQKTTLNLCIVTLKFMSSALWTEAERNFQNVEKITKMHYLCHSPREAVCSSQHKIMRDQDSAADMGSSEVERQLPRPLTCLGYAASNDPGCRLLLTTV